MCAALAGVLDARQSVGDARPQCRGQRTSTRRARSPSAPAEAPTRSCSRPTGRRYSLNTADGRHRPPRVSRAVRVPGGGRRRRARSAERTSPASASTPARRKSPAATCCRSCRTSGKSGPRLRVRRACTSVPGAGAGARAGVRLELVDERGATPSRSASRTRDPSASPRFPTRRGSARMAIAPATRRLYVADTRRAARLHHRADHPRRASRQRRRRGSTRPRLGWQHQAPLHRRQRPRNRLGRRSERQGYRRPSASSATSGLRDPARPDRSPRTARSGWPTRRRASLFQLSPATKAIYAHRAVDAARRRRCSRLPELGSPPSCHRSLEREVHDLARTPLR